MFDSSHPGEDRRGRLAPSSLAVAGLFLLALLFTLATARSLVLPFVAAALLTLLLRAPVQWLVRRGVPTLLSAAVVLLLLLGTFGYGAVRLRDPAAAWLSNLPRSLRQMERKVRRLRQPVEEVSRAAEQVQKMASVGGDDDTPQVEVRSASLTDTLMSGARTFALTSGVTVVLLFLGLSFGDDLVGRVICELPRARDRRRALVMAQEIERSVSRYLVTISLINLGLGAAVGVAMKLLHMPNPWLWGALAGVVNYVPYLGPAVCVAVVGLVAAASFPDLGTALLPPACYFLLTTLEGVVLTPILLGRSFSLNPVLVFGWLFLWGWLWGIVGAILAIPLLTTLKIVCDRVESLAPLGRLLAR